MSKEITMKAAMRKYLEHLEGLGKSQSTRQTVDRDLQLLAAYLGDEKIVSKIIPVHVANFFRSEPVNKIGDPPRDRRPATVLQIKRITRQYLLWAQEQGYLTRAPLPKEEAKFVKEKTNEEDGNGTGKAKGKGKAKMGAAQSASKKKAKGKAKDSDSQTEEAAASQPASQDEPADPAAEEVVVESAVSVSA
jgi:hypothetical protein